MYPVFGKRIVDLLIVIPAIAVLSPAIIFLAAIVRLRLGSPGFFIQERPGFDGRPFRMMKLRTMTQDRDEKGAMLPDERRLTRLGAALRRFSLDELPELFNVLRGDMSLVGPRPLLLEYLHRYTPEQSRRHEAKPGITGWAQVNGRNAITWEEKFKLDVWYVDKMSFWLDLKILTLTLWKIVKREGISQPGHSTMEEFFGTRRP
jgi:sugar transferase EpsL